MLAFLAIVLALLSSVLLTISFLAVNLSILVQIIFLGVALLTGLYPAFLDTAWPIIVQLAFVAIVGIIITELVLDVFHYGSALLIPIPRLTFYCIYCIQGFQLIESYGRVTEGIIGQRVFPVARDLDYDVCMCVLVAYI